MTAGYVAAPGGRPLPVRLDTEAGSWRELVDRAGRAEAVLSAHRDFPVQSLRRELGVPGPRFETVLDPTGTADGTGDELLTVGVTPDGHRAAAAVSVGGDGRRGCGSDRGLPPAQPWS